MKTGGWAGFTVDRSPQLHAPRRRVRADAVVFDALESAFVWAYLGAVEEGRCPDHVETAIGDARAFTTEDFADRPDADLRTEVVPTLYRYVAGFHCAYRDRDAPATGPISVSLPDEDP